MYGNHNIVVYVIPVAFDDNTFLHVIFVGFHKRILTYSAEEVKSFLNKTVPDSP